MTLKHPCVRCKAEFEPTDLVEALLDGQDVEVCRGCYQKEKKQTPPPTQLRTPPPSSVHCPGPGCLNVLTPKETICPDCQKKLNDEDQVSRDLMCSVRIKSLDKTISFLGGRCERCRSDVLETLKLYPLPTLPRKDRRRVKQHIISETRKAISHGVKVSEVLCGNCATILEKCPEKR